ncbi:hypothetical protein DR085_01720 [Mycoplasma flocculare]|uniref:P110/LppT family adhesin N-terminal domain n=1 Tax=Mesomycoplasma flocculare TaxID=2128 RepID=UPI001367D522|nr:P110/LppT family adhesin N-terminal domain [Mesomycoplasma flocculare]MXR13590.1 hypothetical protein [Mesomycoplasma flocculare]
MKKIKNLNFFSNKTTKIIVAISFLSFSATLATAIPLGVWSYNRSYFKKLNEKPETLSISQGENPFTNNLAEFFDNLVVRENFKELSASTALELAKSKIYNLDLLSLVDFTKLYHKKYQISYDLTNAKASGSSIKGLVLFIKIEGQRQIFSKAVEIKGFSEQPENKNLSEFEIDETKSSIVIPNKSVLSFVEFSQSLQFKFNEAKKLEKQSFCAFEKALTELGGSYNLVNRLGLPSFVREGQILEPKLVGDNLDFSSNNNRNYLNFIFENEGRKTNIQLEIKGVTSDFEIKNEIINWIKNQLEDKIKPKSDIQTKLLNQDLSLATAFYSEQSKSIKDSISTSQNFENLFDYVQREYILNTTKFDNYIINLNFKIKKNEEINDQDRVNLLKDSKVRLDLIVNVTKNFNKKIIKILNFKFDWDLIPDLNRFSRIFAKTLPEAKTEVFSITKADNWNAISSKKLVEIINNVKEFAKELNPEVPEPKLVGQLYLLDFGRKATEIEETAYKNELIQIAKNLKTQITKAQTFAEEQSQNESKNGKALGKIIWKALNLQRNLTSYDIRSDLILQNKNDEFILEFSLISNKNNTKLASTKIRISGVVNSAHSSFDVAAKFYPTFFLDGKASFLKQTNKTRYEIKDLSDNNLKFETIDTQRNTVTQEGIELQSPIKFSQNTITLQKNPSTTGQQKFKSAPFSRLDSGLIYYAFRLTNVNDYKKHYLLADSDGNGLFIQKIKKTKLINKANTFEGIAAQKKKDNNATKVVSIISSNNPDKKSKEIQQEKLLDAYVVGLDFKQVKNYKSLQYYFYQNKKSLYSQSSLFTPQLIDKQAVVLGPSSWIPRKNFVADINQNSEGFPPLKEYYPIIELANRAAENRFYRQELKNSNTFFIEKINPIIDQDQNIVFEIIKTPWSFEINAFSSANSHLNSPSSVSLNAKTIYNINPVIQKWEPFPNYLNLDWSQIGPNPEKTSGQNDTNTQNQNGNEQKSTLVLKGLAVYNDPQLTTESGRWARSEIKNAFIKAYLN